MEHRITLSKERLEQRRQDDIESQRRHMQILYDDLELVPGNGYKENEQLAIKLIQLIKQKFNLLF